jgi:peptide/nickel transport system substrate-binding protein
MALALLVVACQTAAPPPAPAPVVERVVTQVVEKVVEKSVPQTVVVEKIVEKAVVVTPVPQPTVAGSDLAADQTLRYVTRGFGRLDPALEAGFGTVVISHLWMPLFIRDTKHNLTPWLASGFEVNADNTVYTVKINAKAVWSDGSPVTAQEAKDYWTYGLHPEDCKACYLSQLNGWEIIKGAKDVIDGKSRDLTGVVVKEDKTLEFNLTSPDPIFIHRLALWNTGFAKMEDVKKGLEYASDGTARVNGPFMIKIWNVDRKQYELVQNPKWWGDKKPTLTRIVLTEAADENISFIQWQNNEVDLALWLTNIKERLRKDQASTFSLMPQPTNLFFYQYTNRAPLDDINVRKALVHAVDWDKAINAAWEGSRNDRIMKTLLTPELPCYKANNWPEWGYDVAKAKQELAATSSPPKGGQNGRR